MMKPLLRFQNRYGLTGTVSPLVATDAGRVQLARLFADCGYTKGAEIGVWAGEYAARLCESVPGLRLTCVDPWRAYGDYKDPKNNQANLDHAYAVTLDRLAPFGCDILRLTSKEAAARFSDGSLDFVYLDANHGRTFVLEDLEAWTPKVRVNGIVAGHDYELVPKHAHLQVKPAVDEFVHARGFSPLYVLARDKSPSFFMVVR